MPSRVKIEKVAALRRRIENAEALVLADYRGLTVSDAGEVRRQLKDAGAEFSVVKNRLLRRAADEAGVSELTAGIDGPTAVAFIGGDPVQASKRLVEATKKYPAMSLKAAYVEGRFLSGEQAMGLASLESREAMLARAAGMLKADLARAAAAFGALQTRMIGLLEALSVRRPAEETEAPAPAAEEPEAPAASEREPAESEEEEEE